jgi:hypothetical protein
MSVCGTLRGERERERERERVRERESKSGVKKQSKVKHSLAINGIQESLLELSIRQSLMKKNQSQTTESFVNTTQRLFKIIVIV